MISLLRILHAIAASRGDGLLPEFLASRDLAHEIPKVADEEKALLEQATTCAADAATADVSGFDQAGSCRRR